MDDGDRRVGVQALQQRLFNGGGAAYAHVNHQGELGLARGVRQRHPIGATVARLGVAGDEDHAMGVLAVGERHVQAGERRQARGNAVDHLHRNACGLQRFHLFAAPAKNKGVAALEPHHLFAALRLADHELFDKRLRRAGAAAAFAHVDHAGAGRGVGQHRVVHQVVHQQHRGAGNGFDRFEREQVGVAGACAHQGDAAHGGARKSGHKDRSQSSGQVQDVGHLLGNGGGNR